ncbi:GntR family transcriptional regulator [Leifsonia xyli subsp. cynodontis DSM 46306]|uniref:HTH gntR-type domain-containing protein n=1 Tax=Leifsonia xyli subsp. cynodontis DSM 46306 TaxID=1389489 RepID=U3P8V2_LEIXC|nr:GntR family transcriptional regulator [Leifsonia xyli]AGW42735.1 GntR family transcriptional regulator [Leifsonia xyli subsp. cynodontis DSM 46306]
MAKYEDVLKDLSLSIAKMQPGERLAGEQALAAQYGVSAMTVRRALQVLIQAKRIIGIRGRGTFVAQPTVTKRMVMASFTDSMKASGMTAHARVLAATIGPAGAEAAADLNIQRNDQIITVERLRFGDDVALSIDRTVLNAERVPGLLGEDLTGSLYELLYRRYGMTLSRAESRVSAVLPTAEEAALLNIPPSQPCLRVHSRSMTDERAIAEQTTSLYRGDRYELSFNPDAET